jgi:hypothetical protein
MARYAIEVVAKAGCGCHALTEFMLEEGLEPTPGDVAGVLYGALDPEVTDILAFLCENHHEGGHEKLTVTACVKVRS